VSKRGVGGMLRNRLARVLLPFLLFWPLLYWLMYWLTMQAVTAVNRPSPMLLVIKQWTLNPNAPAAPPSMMHLWFLVYLMCFCVLVWVADALEIQWPTMLRRRFVALRTSRWTAMLLCVVPLLLVPAMVSVTAPLPAPESLFPQWWALLIYGCYFILGYQLLGREALLTALQPIAWLLLLASMIAYALFLWTMKLNATAAPSKLVHVLQAALQAYAGLWMTLCCLCWGKQFLNRSNRVFRYVADASYWVYLVHLPIIFAIQYYLLDQSTGWGAKLLISVVVTLGLAFASYQLLVRNTVLMVLVVFVAALVVLIGAPGDKFTPSKISW
jgi:glucans biosynthesis protein C